MMSIISVIISGFIIGLVARFLKPGSDSMGFILTTVLGIAGAAVANFIGGAIGLYGANDVAGWIASILGAMLLLFLYSAFVKK